MNDKVDTRNLPIEGSIKIKKPDENIMDFKVEFRPLYLNYEYKFARIDFQFSRCVAIYWSDLPLTKYMQKGVNVLGVYWWGESDNSENFPPKVKNNKYKHIEFHGAGIKLNIICEEYKITPVYFSKIGKQLNYLREKMRNYLAIKRSKEDEKPKIPQFNPKFYGNEEQ